MLPVCGSSASINFALLPECIGNPDTAPVCPASARPAVPAAPLRAGLALAKFPKLALLDVAPSKRVSALDGAVIDLEKLNARLGADTHYHGSRSASLLAFTP